MAIKKVRIKPPGYTDIVHPETQADITKYNNSNSELVATNVQSAIDEITTKIEENKTEIVDGLTSTDATKVLSAKQGKVLKDLVDSKWVYNEDTIKNVKVNNAVNADTVNGKTVESNVPSNAKFTDTTYSEISTSEIDAGTSSTLRAITARRLKYLLDKIVALFPTKTSELTNDSGFLTSVTKSDVGLSNVDNVKQMPISGGVLENYREKLVTLSGTSTAINLSLGNVFTHTLTGNTTYSITNAVNGQAHSFTLIINMGSTVRTLTFPASIKWQGGEIPDMSETNKTYVLTFVSVDGGSNWLGMFGGEF